MKLIPHKIKDVAFLVIEDLYTPEELFYIKNELYFLWSSSIINCRDLGTATKKTDNENLEILANRTGVWLDDVYMNREFSKILTYNRKVFGHEDIVKTFISLNPYHSYYKKLNFDQTLISYYENSSYYKPHADGFLFSIVTWIFDEPKNFTGGNFKFTDINYEIEIKNNMCVIFPSFLVHEVGEVKMLKEDENNPLGRFSITQFSMLHSRITK